jgi:hypothetical protein
MIKFFFVMLLLSIAACSTHQAVLNKNMHAREQNPTFYAHQPFYVFGHNQVEEINLTEFCGSTENIHSFLVRQTFMDGMRGAVTLGIYTPRATGVFCNKEPNKK